MLGSGKMVGIAGKQLNMSLMPAQSGLVFFKWAEAVGQQKILALEHRRQVKETCDFPSLARAEHASQTQAARRVCA